MGYYVSNMIGIRIGGVFSDPVDIEDMKKRIAKIIVDMQKDDYDPPIADDPSHCMSEELIANKGSYVVLAGVFNNWTADESFEFSRRLSEEFGTEVMHMVWDEEINRVHCQIFLRGKPLFDGQYENPIQSAIRRIMGPRKS